MKIQKKIMALGLSLLVLGGTVSSAMAYVYKNGTEYQTVTHKDIPAWGYAKYDTTYGSKKATTNPIATFKKTQGDALLGNFAALINSSKKAVSDIGGLQLNQAILLSEYGCSKGTVYFSMVTSHALEPSNTCDVTMKFSADDLYY